jgi:predicted nucleic acid-binding protein
MSARAFVDTNVFVYLFDDDAPRKQAAAREILRTDGRGRELVLSTQVLQEFYVAVTRKLDRPLDGEAALEAVEAMSELSVVQVDPAMIESAIRLGLAHSVSFWDALIVRAAITSDCAVLLSEDMQDGRHFDELRVENPFRT